MIVFDFTYHFFDNMLQWFYFICFVQIVFYESCGCNIQQFVCGIFKNRNFFHSIIREMDLFFNHFTGC